MSSPSLWGYTSACIGEWHKRGIGCHGPGSARFPLLRSSSFVSLYANAYVAQVVPVTANFPVTSDPLQTSDPRHVTQAITGLQKEVSLVRREAFQVVAHVGSKVTNLEGTVGAMDAKVDVVATCCQTMQGAAAASQHLAFTAASHPVMATHLAGGASSGPSLSRAQLQHLFTFGKKNSALKVCPCHFVPFAHALQLHMPLLSCLQDCLA